MNRIQNRALSAVVFAAALSIGGCGTLSNLFGPPAPAAPPPVTALPTVPDTASPVTLYSPDLPPAPPHALVKKTPVSVQQGSNAPDATKAVQQALNDNGADPQVSVSGNYDAATVAAVRAFQSAHGLAVDGVVGHATWTALGLSGPPADPTTVPPAPPKAQRWWNK
jgi:peptidoglycan hydrolase-like protein with peptidoglycan-binding domain